MFREKVSVGTHYVQVMSKTRVGGAKSDPFAPKLRGIALVRQPYLVPRHTRGGLERLLSVEAAFKVVNKLLLDPLYAHSPINSEEKRSGDGS